MCHFERSPWIYRAGAHSHPPRAICSHIVSHHTLRIFFTPQVHRWASWHLAVWSLCAPTQLHHKQDSSYEYHVLIMDSRNIFFGIFGGNIHFGQCTSIGLFKHTFVWDNILSKLTPGNVNDTIEKIVLSNQSWGCLSQIWCHHNPWKVSQWVVLLATCQFLVAWCHPRQTLSYTNIWRTARKKIRFAVCIDKINECIKSLVHLFQMILRCRREPWLGPWL